MKCKNCKNLINGWCEKKLDSLDPETERKCGDYEVKTNYERIKQMSIEEMAEFICSIYDDNQELYTADKNIEGYTIPDYDEKNIKEWLEMEVEE